MVNEFLEREKVRVLSHWDLFPFNFGKKSIICNQFTTKRTLTIWAFPGACGILTEVGELTEEKILQSRQEESLCWDRLFDWSLAALEPGISQKKFLLSLPEAILKITEIPCAALFLIDHGNLRLEKSLCQGGKSWKVPSDLKEFVQQKGFSCFQRLTPKTLASFHLLPFFRYEIKDGKVSGDPLPQALLILEAMTPPLNFQEILHFFSQYVSFFSSRFQREEEVVHQAKTFSTEYTLLQKSLRSHREVLQNRYSYERIIGGLAPSMKELYQLLDRIIPSKISVLLHGESGTGKELLAKAIHYNGSLANKPLICINCAALNAQILEGQLFGYVKGAFTGATQDQKGLIEQAHGGTLFLDEIGDLSLEIQTKFLRVLQEGEVLPLGSHQVRKVKIRVISATHRDLTQDVKVGRFREDLYYRLAKIHVPVPALRERREDIPLLIDYFLKDFAKKTGSPIKKISQKALTCLQNAPWPGNVRQLENTLKMILTLNPSARINSAHLPPELLPASKREKPPRLAKARNKFMKEYFAYLFNQAGGQIRVAAELADVKRESLYRIMRKVSFR